MKIEYAGEKFCGSQMQSGVRTVQEDIERGLNAFFRTREERAIKVTLSGRTDTGVHALGQVLHFDLSDEFLLRAFSFAPPQVDLHSGGLGSTNNIDTTGGGATIDCGDEDLRRPASDPTLDSKQARSLRSQTLNVPSERAACYTISQSADGQPLVDDAILKKVCWALNGILGHDVSIVQAQVVPQHFNARFSAFRRTYVYRILNRPQRSALRHNMQYFVPAPLDTEAMKLAAECLLGTHDFKGFKSSNADESSTICRVERAELLKKGESELEFWISANHFVYNMVRIIVGTLIEIGLGKRAPSDLAKALAGKDRHLAGPTAASRGLCLYSVDYPAEFCLFQRDHELVSVSQEK